MCPYVYMRMRVYYYSVDSYCIVGCPRGVMVKILDCRIVEVSVFDLQ